MANPFYQPNNTAFMPFIQFMNAMKGKDPNKILNEMVSSGKVNQQQLNVAQQKAKQVGGMFESLRGMFGF